MVVGHGHRGLVGLWRAGVLVVPLVKGEQDATQPVRRVARQPRQPQSHRFVGIVLACAKGAHEDTHFGTVDVTGRVQDRRVVSHGWVHAARAASAATSDVAVIIEHWPLEPRKRASDERHCLDGEVHVHRLRLVEWAPDERIERAAWALARSRWHDCARSAALCLLAPRQVARVSGWFIVY